MINEQSIRARLIRMILTISSISLLVAFTVFFTYEIYSYRKTMKRRLDIQALMVAQNVTAALAFDDVDEARSILQSLSVEPKIEVATLYKTDSSIFVHVAFDSVENTTPIMTLPRELTERSSEYLEVLIPVTQGEKHLGALYIKRSMKDVKDRIAVYLLVALIVLIVCFILAYLLSKRLEKKISAPIIALANTAKIISDEHDYSIRAETDSEGELHTLTKAFNLMLSRIEAQNHEIQQHADELEMKVQARTMEIKRQKDFAEAIINSSLVMIAVFDTECRFIIFNKRCEMEFGLLSEDVLGKRYADVMPNIVGSPAYKAVIRALNGEEAHYGKYQSPVTGEYYENFATPLYNEKNEVYAALLTAHNITATVTANDRLHKSNEELKKKNTDLEQFAYVASHDLQEPLRKIHTFADLAVRTNADPNHATRYLQKIQASADRMTLLIRDVLDYSRLSKPEESLGDADLNMVLEYVKSDFELLIMEKDAAIESDVLPVMKGHKLQLHQLFANLISNALKFNERTPLIKIKLHTVEADEVKSLFLPGDKQYFKLTFSDNGIGFEPRFKDRLFTIFQRLNPREKYEGTGIGLALCKKIVDNHHGHISVDSVPGEGSVFTVVMPYE